MRRMSPAGVLVAAVLALGGGELASPALAREAPAPWCAVLSIGPGDAYWDCRYQSLEQCVPNVLSGNRGFCNPNPAFSGPAEQKKVQFRHRRRYRHSGWRYYR